MLSNTRKSPRWALVVAVSLSSVGCLAFAVAAEKGEELGDMMEKVHEGKRSPYRQVKTQVAADAPAWDVIDKQLSAFANMSKALKTSRNAEVRDSADGYADAVAALTAAAKKRDIKTAREAVKALSNSCADCHFKGGPGGDLD